MPFSKEGFEVTPLTLAYNEGSEESIGTRHPRLQSSNGSPRLKEFILFHVCRPLGRLAITKSGWLGNLCLLV